MSDFLVKTKEYIHDKPIEKQGDVILMKEASNLYEKLFGLSVKYYSILACTWTIREPILIKAIMDNVEKNGNGALNMDEIVENLRKLYKDHGDSIREHTPIRIWNNHYNPNKIQKTWNNSNFDKVGYALYGYFEENKYSFDEILQVLSSNIAGCGPDYGAKNCLRLLHLCRGIPIPDVENYQFYEMSPALKPSFDFLYENGITNCKEFREYYGVDWDRTIITYWICMVLKKKLENE